MEIFKHYFIVYDLPSNISCPRNEIFLRVVGRMILEICQQPRDRNTCLLGEPLFTCKLIEAKSNNSRRATAREIALLLSKKLVVITEGFY